MPCATKLLLGPTRIFAAVTSRELEILDVKN
jgi:hypothetical protein